MAVATTAVAWKFLSVVAGVPIGISAPLFQDTDIEVYYGLAQTLATRNVHYSITLNPNNDDFASFEIIPLLALTVQMALLEAADPFDVNYIAVRRKTNSMTTATSALVKSTPFSSREFDRNSMRDLEHDDWLKRAIVQSPVTVEPFLPMYVKERLQLNETFKGDANGHLLRGPNLLTLEERVDALETLAITLGNFLPATTQEMIDGVTNVKGATPFNIKNSDWFVDGKISLAKLGAKGDFNIGTQTGTDDTNAFLDAIDLAQDLVASGQPALGTMQLPFGYFRVTQKLDFNFFNAWLYGVGKGATQIVLDHSDYGLRFYRSLSHCKHLAIRSSTARNALAYDNLRPGLLHLGVSGGMQASHCQYQDVTIMDNPGHGFVGVVSGSEIDVEAQNNKGHGIVIDTGKIFDGTALMAAPADIQFQGFNVLDGCRSFGNGGNGYVCGNPNDSAAVVVYRTDIHNFDSFLNATNAAVRVTDDDSYLTGIGNKAFTCGISPPATKGGWTLSGRECEIHDQRVVGAGSYAVHVIAHATLGTFGGFVGIDTVIGPPAPLNPAVVIDAGVAQGIDVEARITSNITTLATAGKYGSQRFGNTLEMRGGRMSADNFYSNLVGSVADDHVLVIDFTLEFSGVMILWGETTFGRASIIHFKVGASPFCNVLPIVSGQVVGTTGVLAGTTGADGIVTVSTHTDGKMYIENRTGSTRQFSYGLFTLSAGLIDSITVVP